MMKDTPQVQTMNFDPEYVKQLQSELFAANGRIDELERYNAYLLQELKEADGWLEYLNPASLPDDQHRQAFDAYAWRIEDILCGEYSAQSDAWLNKKHVEWMKNLPVAAYLKKIKHIR